MSVPSASRPRVAVAGDRVSRPAGWWTPTVHAFLEHLRANGFPHVPRPLGVRDGREVLGHIPGDSGPDGWARVVPYEGLRAFARFLRAFHEASRGFAPPPGAVWALADTGGPAPDGHVICHGDFGPWNVVWDGPEPVGLLDFDLAGPGGPLEDVAYALEYTAPFRDDAEALRWLRYPEAPDRRERIAVFADAYGVPAGGLVDAVIARQERTARDVIALADRGAPQQRALVAEGWLDTMAERVAWSRANRELFG